MNFKIKTFESLDSMDKNICKSFLEFHTEIFGETYTRELSCNLPRRHNVSIFIAQDESGIVGFKSGCEQSSNVYYSWSGAVHPRARKSGIGTSLMRTQHEWCKAKGYIKVQTKTKNKWKDMIVLNVRNGFDIIGAYTDEKGEPKLILEKQLA